MTVLTDSQFIIPLAIDWSQVRAVTPPQSVLDAFYSTFPEDLDKIESVAAFCKARVKVSKVPAIGAVFHWGEYDCYVIGGDETRIRFKAFRGRYQYGDYSMLVGELAADYYRLEYYGGIPPKDDEL